MGQLDPRDRSLGDDSVLGWEGSPESFSIVGPSGPHDHKDRTQPRVEIRFGG